MVAMLLVPLYQFSDEDSSYQDSPVHLRSNVWSSYHDETRCVSVKMLRLDLMDVTSSFLKDGISNSIEAVLILLNKNF
ncbi:hypothetical protein CEXT_443671 [Caerostris extrusa]|uniref:Uncharacterized protein n=1 Tax=Caerostris extrusa TaxID=172846 RepID=A0AAV4XQM8_CAEEX|nr:hypothetical protein CEXT_443671 [Caerostris extrusa]